jgi:hypothetical protein
VCVEGAGVPGRAVIKCSVTRGNQRQPNKVQTKCFPLPRISFNLSKNTPKNHEKTEFVHFQFSASLQFEVDTKLWQWQSSLQMTVKWGGQMPESPLLLQTVPLSSKSVHFASLWMSLPTCHGRWSGERQARALDASLRPLLPQIAHSYHFEYLIFPSSHHLGIVLDTTILSWPACPTFLSLHYTSSRNASYNSNCLSLFRTLVDYVSTPQILCPGLFVPAYLPCFILPQNFHC